MTEVVWSPLEPVALWQTAALAPQPLSAPADPGSDSDSTAAILARGTVSVGAVIPQASPICWTPTCTRYALPAAWIEYALLAISCTRAAQAAVAGATCPVRAEARRPTNGKALNVHAETFGDRRGARQRWGVEGRPARRRRASPPLALCRLASCQPTSL